VTPGSHGCDYDEVLSSKMLELVVWFKFTGVSGVVATSHRPVDGDSKHLMNVSNFYKTTWRNTLEDSHLHYGLDS
jgi:hypothetical protein